MANLFTRIITTAKSLLLRQVVYLDEQHYKLTAAGRLEPIVATKSKVLVLSRHCYTEQVQWLPVTSKADAKKLVKFQQATKDKGSLYILGQPLNGKIPVIWYQLKPPAMAHNALLYLPETLLIAEQYQIGDVVTYRSPDNKADIFISRTHAGAVSAIKGGMLQTDSQFMLAQGSSLHGRVAINGSQFQQHVLKALFKLYQFPLAGLINKAAMQRNSTLKSVSRYMWPLAGSITLYLLFMGYIAEHLQQNSRVELQQANNHANQLLLQREHINNMINRYQQLQQVLPESDNLLQLWQVLAPLYQQGVVINNVQQRQAAVSLSIEATSATEALQLLVKQLGVTNAKVEGNVRRQGDKDLATVSFQLQQGAS
ncbi:hypothetical protein [Rheinheimera metallidurans]|uniref:hypothetical protein n=1 Tax=Rheinheimera metallidurans TaxID=2925781 RepID=UPI0030015D88